MFTIDYTYKRNTKNSGYLIIWKCSEVLERAKIKSTIYPVLYFQVKLI